MSKRSARAAVVLATGADRAGPAGLTRRVAFVLVVLAALLLVFRERLLTLDFAAIPAMVRAIAPWQWLAALGCTAASFWAIGRYDRVVHAALGTGIPAPQAARAGIAAIAIAQTVGLGVVTGAFVRWRLLPTLGLWQATRLALVVALSFLAGLAVLASVLVLATGFPSGLTPLAWGVLVAGLALPVLAAFPPPGLPMPPLRAMVSILGLVVVDCAATALTLAALMPAEIMPSLPVLITAVVLALGAGLVSSTPGGIGPFEVTLLALLPAVPAEPLLASVLAFRLVYHVLPAVLAAILALLLSLRPAPDSPAPAEGARPMAPSRLADRRLAAARRAESALVSETGLALFTDGTPVATLARAGSCLVGLGDAWLVMPDHVARLSDAATGACLVPVLYKAGAKTALQARAAGWRVLRIADEAWLDPRDFRDDIPARRQLRRRLRKAESAGVTVVAARGRPPIDRLTAINAAWAAAHGPERGFSMGRFPSASLTEGRTFLAWHGDEIVAFATFHASWGEWTLDLMRYAPEAPDGTMPLLIRSAIDAAAAEGVPRLSLAAVPRLACHLPRHLADRFDAMAGTEGLTRFKAAFAPSWEPLYAAGPDLFRLGLGLVSIARAVHSRQPHPGR